MNREREGGFIRWLQDADAQQVALVGGKGANLGRLVRLGLPVPPGFVVTTDAYRALLAATGLLDAEEEQPRERITSAPMPSTIRTPILDAYQQLGASTVAVRSSGTAEDLATASFAGQYDTFLNVAGPEALLSAVRACWASLWSPRAIDYRRRGGWDDHDLALAVVVQTMAPAEWAGVLFTADPVSGRRDRLIVEAVPGLGEALVSGQVSGARYVFEKSSPRLLDGDGLAPRRMLEELARLAARIEAAFGQPQDIEWAYAEGRCAILQARPLTALPDEDHETVSRDGRRYSRLQRAMAPNAMDHMPLPPYPFDYSLFFRPLMRRTLQAVRSLGFSTPAVEDTFIEIAAGVVQQVPPTVRPTLRALTLPGKLATALRANREDWLEECRRTLVAPAQRIDALELARLSEQALLEHIVTLQHLQVELLVRRFGYLAPGLLLGQGFALLLRLAVGDDAPRRRADLLAAVPCITTAANQELGRLAQLIRRSPELRRLFLDQDPEYLTVRLSESVSGLAFRAEMDAFLRRYGYRESAMPSAALPAWRDDPDIVYGLLKGLAAGELPVTALDAGDGQRAVRAKNDLCVALTRSRFDARRLLLPPVLRLLAATRSVIAFREDSHFYLFMVFPVIRRLALEVGHRWVTRGVLEEAGDIFFLEIDEIREPAPVGEVREIVRQRKLGRRSVEGGYTPVPVALLERTATASDVHGAAASPGKATGRVRVIASEREFWKLQQGEVLVSRYTNPAWTPLFALAAAVVVDAGGMASHAAIVAREYGIPAVMGAGNATRLLRDGQRVLVDGDRGRVVLLGEGSVR